MVVRSVVTQLDRLFSSFGAAQQERIMRLRQRSRWFNQQTWWRGRYRLVAIAPARTVTAVRREKRRVLGALVYRPKRTQHQAYPAPAVDGLRSRLQSTFYATSLM